MRRKNSAALLHRRARPLFDGGRRATGLWEDFLLLPAALLTAAFYSAEQERIRFSRAFLMQADGIIERMPNFMRGFAIFVLSEPMAAFGRTFAVFSLLVLIFAAFSNGLRRRRSFIALCSLTILLPRLWLVFFPSPDYERKLVLLATNFSSLLVRMPFLVLSDWLGQSGESISTILLFFILFSFTMGWLYDAKRRRSKKQG